MLIGIRGAWRRGSAFDRSSLLGSLVLYSMPEGWLGMLLLVALRGVRSGGSRPAATSQRRT